MLRDQWRRSRIGNALLFAIFCSFSPQLITQAVAQVDACDRPSGPVGQIICDDPDLADLNLSMGDAFREHIRTSPRSQRREILRSQRDWLRVRNGCLTSNNRRECLRIEIESRITDLSQGLAGSVNTRRDFEQPGDTQLGFDDDTGFEGNTEFDTRVNPAPLGNAQPPLADPFAAQGTTVPQGARDLVRQKTLPTIEGANSNDQPAGGAPGSPRSLPLPPRVGGPQPQVGDIVGGPRPLQGVGTSGPAPAVPSTAPSAVKPSAPGASETATDAKATKDSGKPPEEIIEFLSGSVWRAEIASGIRPGTIFIFQANGILVTADCVEAYNIGKWRVESKGLRLEDGSKRDLFGEIIESGPGFVRLKLTPKGKTQSLDIVFRAARGPFACTSSR